MARRASRLVDEVARARPDLVDPAAAIRAGRVLVDGRFVDNPASLVRAGSSVVVREADAPLRGERKLGAALDRFGVDAAGRVALDAGAAAGGFTTVLLERGARRVYAVDAGHGQLRGSLRQDPRVVDLEGTNLGALDRARVPDEIEVVTLDLSYLALAEAVPQLGRVALAAGADLVALVKPMFELHLPAAPADRPSLDRALARAAAGIEVAGWAVAGWMDSPVRGARGAPELFVHAVRPGPGRPPGGGETPR